VTHVLLIEDDDRIRLSLEHALVDRGYVVTAAGTGFVGYDLLVARHPDVTLLDLGLPDLDGLDVLALIRAVSPAPVIVATARDGDVDIVRTLEAGADDYLVKPFSVDHLDARIKAVLRRTQPGVAERVTVGALDVDPSTRTATLDGRILDLSRKEFDLLAYLAARSERVVPKRELLSEIWDQPWGGADKTVDVHLSWLRRKLGESASEPRYLRSVRGVGVQLVDPAG
jgi:DNA-binding response OmpR family regulator